MFPPWVVWVAFVVAQVPTSAVSGYKRNYDAKYTNTNIPQWKQRACDKTQKLKANSHYICDDKGDVKCLPGWQGDLCQVPMCRRGCDPMNGYCQRPGECRCRIGYSGEFCDKCMTLPGCQHGYCTKPFECLCKPGWDGLFCTEPTCRSGCHSTRGYCEAPGECRCRIGWSGRNCSDCAVLPGCQHGTCNKPLDCVCERGYTGLLCQTPLCASDCSKQHGYCRKPAECRCKVGWTGPNCDKCFPYPGCANGDCEKPWECNCKPGWGGMLCDEKLSYCEDHPQACENGGKCIALTKEDGSYRCHCRQGYLGKNCEIVDEFMLTSTAAPRITPPPLPNRSDEDDYDEAQLPVTSRPHLLLPTYGPKGNASVATAPATASGEKDNKVLTPTVHVTNATALKATTATTPTTAATTPATKIKVRETTTAAVTATATPLTSHLLTEINVADNGVLNALNGTAKGPAVSAGAPVKKPTTMNSVNLVGAVNQGGHKTHEYPSAGDIIGTATVTSTATATAASLPQMAVRSDKTATNDAAAADNDNAEDGDDGDEDDDDDDDDDDDEDEDDDGEEGYDDEEDEDES